MVCARRARHAPNRLVVDRQPRPELVSAGPAAESTPSDLVRGPTARAPCPQAERAARARARQSISPSLRHPCRRTCCAPRSRRAPCPARIVVSRGCGSRFWKHEQFVGNVERRMSTSATWMRIFLYFRALFYFAHWMGCIWWGIGYVEYQCVQANLRARAAAPLPRIVLRPPNNGLCYPLPPPPPPCAFTYLSPE